MAETTRTAQLPYGVPPPAFRLSDAAHPGAVHLQVSDLPRSLAYYERVLGLNGHSVTGTSAVLSAQGDEQPLVTLHARPGVTRARRGAFGLYHFAILLPERSALGRFAAHLASLEVRIGMADHLVSEALYLGDPDGLGIEVYADRPRDTWQRHDRELAMTTDPLDIRDVIAAGRGGAWTGAPKGTTMGRSSTCWEPGTSRGLLPSCAWPRQDGMELSRSPVHVRGRISPPLGNEYMVVWAGRLSRPGTTS